MKNEIKGSFDSANPLKRGVPCDSYISPHNVVPTKAARHLTNARPKMTVKSNMLKWSGQTYATHALCPLY